MDLITNVLLSFTYVFAIGSIMGWFLEVVFRRFFSKNNPKKKWINPGYFQGPYIPLYGFSLIVLFAMSHIPVDFIENPISGKIILFIIMALAITLLEYLVGSIYLNIFKIKLWDYSGERCNIKGIVCPKFSLYWMALCIAYYFFLHPGLVSLIFWLKAHPSFSPLFGLFYGALLIDLFFVIRKKMLISIVPYFSSIV